MIGIAGRVGAGLGLGALEAQTGPWDGDAGSLSGGERLMATL